MKLNKGYVQVYTGDGKGKTTACIGLAVRALSRGLSVCLIRFLKGNDESGECEFLRKSSPNITIINTGLGDFITTAPKKEEINEAKRGLNEAGKAINSNKYDLVILEEINVAIDLNLIKLDELVKIIKNKPENVEIVLTGRGAKKEIIDVADLVTEMKKIKHYYDKGVSARRGIEK